MDRALGYLPCPKCLRSGWGRSSVWRGSGIRRRCGGGLLRENQRPSGLPGDIQPRPSSSHRIGLARSQAQHLWIPAPLFRNAVRRGPAFGIRHVLAEAGVDPLLRESGGATGAIHQHHVPLDVRVPMHRWPPERICFRRLPAYLRRKDWSRAAGQAGLPPVAIVVFPDIPGRCEPQIEGQPGHHHSLTFQRSTVVGEQEIEEFLPLVEDHGEVAMAAGEISVFGTAVHRIPRT